MPEADYTLIDESDFEELKAEILDSGLSVPELRAVAEVYAFDGARERFVKNFMAALSKVMRLDRFDLKHSI